MEPRDDGAVVIKKVVVIEKDGRDHLMYERPYVTEWKILVGGAISLDLDKVDCVYRTGLFGDGECEIFTILAVKTEFVLVRLKITSDGLVSVATYVPAEVEVDAHERQITICLLDIASAYKG